MREGISVTGAGDYEEGLRAEGGRFALRGVQVLECVDAALEGGP
jgi:hypothetical protein